MEYFRILFFLSLIAFSVFSFGQTTTTAGGEKCAIAETANPPFLLTSGPQDGTNPTAVSASPTGGISDSYVPQNSIVQVTTDHYDKSDGNLWLPIKVLSTPSTITDDHAKPAPDPIKNLIVGRGRRGQAGDSGYIQQSNLVSAGNSSYLVKKNAPLLKLPDGTTKQLVGKVLRLVMTGSKYKVNRCCVGIKPNETCSDDYFFETIAPDTGKRLEEFAVPECANLADSLRPIPVKLTKPIVALVREMESVGMNPDEFELVDSKGYIKFPSNIDGTSIYGSYHYNPDGGPDINYDAFMQADAACAYKSVLKQHQQDCKGPGCEIQWGDMFHPVELKVHEEHFNGTCVDMRMMKKNDDRDAVIYNDAKYSQNYDRKKTIELLKLLKSRGADPIYYNDTAAQIDGVTSYHGHDNHIHACFDPNKAEVLHACEVSK